jgi:hypothetical protein
MGVPPGSLAGGSGRTSMTARTITTRVLVARAREHGRALTTLGDSVEWSGMAWSEVVGDPEWVYNATARDACTTVAARFLAGTRGVRCGEVDDLRPSGTAPRTVGLSSVRVLPRGSRASAARLGLGWLGGGRRSQSTSANR